MIGRTRLSTEFTPSHATYRWPGHRGGMTPPYTRHSDAPLSTNIAIEERVVDLIGRAISRRLWVLFLDSSDVQLPVLVPIDGLPRVPEWPDTVRVVRRVDEIMQHIGAARLVLVWERFASPRLSGIDLIWVRQLAAVCDDQEIRLRAVVLSHRAGIRWIAPDDFAF